MAIMKSHGVQINTDPKKTLIWKKTLSWELFDMFEKTQTKNCYTGRFFTMDKVQQKYSNANNWSFNNNHQVSQCPNQY